MATPDAPRPLSALGARVGDAAAALPEAERTALLLRDRDRVGYERIAEAAGVPVEAVPDLLVAARLAVREAVRDVESPPAKTPECAEARRRLTRRQDGEGVEGEDASWLEAHLAGCDACRLARRALREGALAAQAWDGVVPEDPHRGGTVLDEEDFVGGLPDFVPGPPAPRRGHDRVESRALPVRRNSAGIGSPPPGRDGVRTAVPQRDRPAPPRRGRSRVTGMLAAGAIAAGLAAVALVVVTAEAPSSASDGGAVAEPAATTEPVALQRQGLTQQERLDRRRAAARRAARREARRLARLRAERRRDALAERAAAARAPEITPARPTVPTATAAGPQPSAMPIPAPEARQRARLEPVRTPAPPPVAQTTPAPESTPDPSPTPQAVVTAPPPTPAATAAPATG